ncbi:MAG: hypothetical protein V1806_03195 [Pseudomonadota bacterium]
MSKIDQLQPGQSPQTPQSPPAARPQDGEAFQNILEQATRQAGAAPSESAGQATAPTQATQAISAGQAAGQASAVAQDVSPLQREGLLRAGRTLDLLDAYAQSLADPGQPLKKVAGLVKSLEEEGKGLGQLLEGMDPQDGLYGLLQEVASTAQVESLKFNRGDYVEG